MIPPRLRTRAFWVTLVDVAVILFASSALVVVLGGRTRIDVDGVRVSIRGATNLFLLAAAFGVFRLAIGRRLGPLPAVRPGDFSRFEEERLRLARTDPASREVWICAGLTLAGSLIWIAPHLWHIRAVPDPGDPLYSAWSIARLIHQLTTDPRHLFDGNIFFPLPRTLTYSDMRFLEAFVGAPFLIAGVDPLIVANALMLVAFPACGLATFYAAWRLTGDPRAALVAGMLGAWHPFHAEHYSHLELNWVMFVPLATIAGLRLIAAPSRRRGFIFGLAVAGQWLASMYIGVMLMSFLVPLLAVAAIAWRLRPTRGLLAAALAAGVVLAPALAMLGYPYMRGREAHGERGLQEVQDGSAVPTDYGATHIRLTTYSWHTRRGNHGEREIFPGTSILALGAIGMIPPLTGASIAAIVAGAAAFDWSLGLNGLTYDDLNKRLLVYRGMRVPARFSVILGSALALLGAIGARRLIRLGRSPRTQAAICGVLAAGVLFDLRFDPRLRSYFPTMPAIYDRVTPDMVLAELPRDNHDIDYMYFSTRHWAHLIGGYSGYIPIASDVRYGFQHFPEPDALARLHAFGATHVTYNCAFESRPWRCDAALKALAENPTLELVAGERWQNAQVALYKFK
ncbi:MAG TPA: hypothetical protein VEL51_22705 [Vicinamibacterales bacterium]|nr:hypothetical protein [Vicinamibacterales bacterium]